MHLSIKHIIFRINIKLPILKVCNKMKANHMSDYLSNSVGKSLAYYIFDRAKHMLPDLDIYYYHVDRQRSQAMKSCSNDFSGRCTRRDWSFIRGRGEARGGIDLWLEDGSGSCRGQHRPSSTDTGPGIQEIVDLAQICVFYVEYLHQHWIRNIQPVLNCYIWCKIIVFCCKESMKMWICFELN